MTVHRPGQLDVDQPDVKLCVKLATLVTQLSYAATNVSGIFCTASVDFGRVCTISTDVVGLLVMGRSTSLKSKG